MTIKVSVLDTTGAGSAIGTPYDAPVSSDMTGTISGKLRGLVKILSDVWDSSGHYLRVSLATKLDTNDQIDVAKMSKGPVILAHNAIASTATSAEIDCRGFNALLVHTVISGPARSWTIKVQGAVTSGGDYADCSNDTMMSYQTSGSKAKAWHGIPDFVKIMATENEDGATATVNVQPLNM